MERFRRHPQAPKASSVPPVTSPRTFVRKLSPKFFACPLGQLNAPSAPSIVWRSCHRKGADVITLAQLERGLNVDTAPSTDAIHSESRSGHSADGASATWQVVEAV